MVEKMISPCIKLCVIDKETRKCKGCGRTIEQITNWSKYTDEERLKIISNNIIDKSS